MANPDLFATLCGLYENYARYVHSLNVEGKLVLLSTIITYVTAVIAVPSLLLRFLLMLLAAWLLLMVSAA
jgi:hypothetical protein